MTVYVPDANAIIECCYLEPTRNKLSRLLEAGRLRLLDRVSAELEPKGERQSHKWRQRHRQSETRTDQFRDAAIAIGTDYRAVLTHKAEGTDAVVIAFCRTAHKEPRYLVTDDVDVLAVCHMLEVPTLHLRAFLRLMHIDRLDGLP